MIYYYIIGVGPGNPDLITKAAEKTAYSMNVLCGGKRQLDLFPHFSGPTIEIGGDLEEFWKKLHTFSPPYGILASGDPMLYSITEFILRKIDPSQVEIIPGISSIQYLLAKQKESYWHIEVISKHWKNKTKGGYFRFILNPESKDIESEDIVGENLSLLDEKIKKGTPPKGLLSIAMKRIQHLPIPGIPDKFFFRNGSPMTKEEVRVIIISKLLLKEGGVIWDLGAGTGALSCEIARISPSITVYAVERKKERIKIIEENKKRFGLFNIEIVEGEVLKEIEKLPPPSSIFIGGGGKEIEDIFKEAYKKLLPGGKMVFSAITVDTAYKGYKFLKERMKNPKTISIQIEKGEERGGLLMMLSQNRIFIGEGTK